jgi:hypothetical protein
MNDAEKIVREWTMQSRAISDMRISYLLRIMRNKREPLSARYAALIHCKGLYSPSSIFIPSEECMLAEIKQMIHFIDSSDK